jgi:tripartite-type tricarboxylate transporter receptor subunit TctC
MATWRRARSVALVSLAATTAHGVAQESVEQFYRAKKTIEIVIGFPAGGGYDAYARLVARFMGDHLPGHPAFVAKNMTGAGGLTAATYIHDVAPKDGAALGVTDQSIPLERALGNPSIKFDPGDFNWIGNPSVDNNVVATWSASGVRTIEDARKKEIDIGASGFNASSQYPTTLNAIAGTKFKVINGYRGGTEINLAMERGEVSGRGSNSWASWKATRPDWIRDGKIFIIAQIGLERASDLPNVPTLIDLATNGIDRKAMVLLSSPTAIGKPIFAPPGVPKERVAALRAAFDATMKDPAFLAAAAKEHLVISPASGERLQKIVAEIGETPAPVKDRLAAILSRRQR